MEANVSRLLVWSGRNGIGVVGGDWRSRGRLARSIFGARHVGRIGRCHDRGRWFERVTMQLPSVLEGKATHERREEARWEI